jgi:hypothetical protein
LNLYIGTGYGLSIWKLNSWEFVAHYSTYGTVERIFLGDDDKIVAQVAKNVQVLYDILKLKNNFYILQWWDFSNRNSIKVSVVVIAGSEYSVQQTSLGEIFNFTSSLIKCQPEIIVSRKVINSPTQRVYLFYCQSELDSSLKKLKLNTGLTKLLENNINAFKSSSGTYCYSLLRNIEDEKKSQPLIHIHKQRNQNSRHGAR